MNPETVRKNTAWKQFLSDARRRLGHAYIFISEDDELMAALLHHASLACFCPDVCGECDVCQSIADGSHPDIYRGDGSAMKVEDVEPLLDRVEILPVRSDKKVFVIKNADKLSPQVQNKLLKTFEEPPAYVTIILGASGESGLLSTIRSRGKKLYADLLSTEDITAELVEDGVNKTSAGIAAAYGMGNLKKAQDFAQSGDYREQYEKVFDMLIHLKKSSQIASYVVQDIFSKEKIALTVDFMEIILGDAMKTILHTTAQKCNVNRDADLTEVASGFTAAGLSMALNAVNKAKEQLFFNVNAANVANDVLFGILEARYKWKKN